jgi:exosortase
MSLSLRQGDMTRRNVYFAFALVASIVICIQPLSMLMTSVLTREQYSHIVLVPPLTLAFLYLERKRIFERVEYGILQAAILCILMTATASMLRSFGVSPGDEELSLTILSLVTVWLASFLFCYGPRSFRRASFPLLFLLLVVPISGSVLARTTSVLQQGSADAAYLLFRMIDVPVIKDGLFLSLPGVNIEVAKECSGIRSFFFTLITGLVFGQLFLRSRGRKLILTLCVLPVAMLKNGLRIFVLSTLSIYVDPRFLHGNLHRNGGSLFFVLGIGCLTLILWVLYRGEKKKNEEASMDRQPRICSSVPTSQ